MVDPECGSSAGDATKEQAIHDGENLRHGGLIGLVLSNDTTALAEFVEEVTVYCGREQRGATFGEASSASFRSSWALDAE